MSTMVTLDWDPPEGTGPEAVVDNYTITISPPSPYQPARITVTTLQWNVTLEHNTVYSINLTAENCIGESEPSSLSNIEFGTL